MGGATAHLAGVTSFRTGDPQEVRSHSPLAPGVAQSRWPVGTAASLAMARSSTNDWPELHKDSRLGGHASMSPLTAGNASRLGVAWATDLYGAALDSPVVAYDPLLGKTLAYIGTESGNVLAIDAGSGRTVWGAWLGSPILSTPAVYNGSLYVATARTPAMYRLNSTTGVVECSVVSPESVAGSPTVFDAGKRNATVFFGAEDTNTVSGPLMAMDANSCRILWTFTGYAYRAGSWDPLAAAVNRTGVALVLFGTADPDSSVYALNAKTGKEIWRFQTYNPPPGVFDVGAGVTVSPPGANGFPDGVAYVPTKFGDMYALDLSDGALIWNTSFNTIAGVTEGGRSTAALDGENLVFGYNGGLFDLNATSGAVLWRYTDPGAAEAISSPAIAGVGKHAIAVVGDVRGGVDVVAMSNGTMLYRYQTGGYITASPAVSGGNLLIASTDGFLYDFAVGGGNSPILPTTTIVTPVDGAFLPNPNGATVAGGWAKDTGGIAGVIVAVQSGGPTGPWWDASTATWSPGPIGNPATLNRSATPSTVNWSFGFPAPTSGGSFQLTAYAIASSGQSDLKGALVEYAINYSTKGPHLRATASYVAPGGTVTVLGGGFGASEKVTISLAGAILASAVVSATGFLAALPVPIPVSASFGQGSLNATGTVSGKSATTPLSISNSWTQFGSDPTHSNFAPNDPTLDNLITPGGRVWTKLAWHLDTGAAINGTPVVVGGIAYVATAAGQVLAVDIHNGAVLWTWSDGSGGALNGTPAIDVAAGLIFVSSVHGLLAALSIANGHLAWNATMNGSLSSATVANDQVFVDSSTGGLDAFVETNGARAWNRSFTASFSSPPALDGSKSLLVVGEVSGDLRAVNSSTGKTVWTYVAKGAIAAAASVAYGMVFVGSSDGNVTALRESTGTKLWAYQTGGPVNDSPALSDSGTPGGNSRELIIGSADGNLYELSAVNGSANFIIRVGSPIIGVAAAKGVAVFETSTGAFWGARTYASLITWNSRPGGPLASSPAIVDGTIFVGAENGNLYAF
ncbi:MAG: PQQ-binding-like beta-propeller repeat protein, partial [Thermoplasmata archaeon]|nr:PQQ-binding-like beta-propeller repeat protein [Thermoplasmata archaeon]